MTKKTIKELTLREKLTVCFNNNLNGSFISLFGTGKTTIVEDIIKQTLNFKCKKIRKKDLMGLIKCIK